MSPKKFTTFLLLLTVTVLVAASPSNCLEIFFHVDTLESKNFPLLFWVLVCVWKGNYGNVGLQRHDKASHQPHHEVSASCFMFSIYSHLFSVSSFEAPIKQNRFIKYEGISEVGSCTYSNRLFKKIVHTLVERTVRRRMPLHQWLLMTFLLGWVRSGRVQNMWAFCCQSSIKLVIEVYVTV